MNDHAFSDAALRELRIQAPAPPDEVLAARRMLNAAIATERRTQPGRLGRLATALSAAAAVVAAVAVVLAVSTVGAPSATAVLFDLVEAVTRAEPLAQAEGELVYVRSEGVSLRGADDRLVWLQPFTDERWIAADGSFRVRQVLGEPRFFSDADRRAYLEDPDIRAGEQSEFTADFPAPQDPVPLSELPLDTDLLRQALIDAYRLEPGDPDRSLEADLAGTAANLVARPDAAPELRAALLALLAGTPGLDVVDSDLGTVTVGFEYGVGDGAARLRSEYVLDAASGRLVESRVVHVEPAAGSGVPAGTTERTSYDAPVVVDEAG